MAQGPVLIASSKEEGSDLPGVLLLGQRVDMKEAWEVRAKDGTDRVGTY